ncbi:sialate O-acetylesterase [Bacteroides sp.]|uniref:sialate O-acetylesterase n=1 Tax=Bacteroides sp. TaxID=29523 RepID=UPI00261D8C02|nr:sialate O-acetylesterase [Bacteroides sp.]
MKGKAFALIFLFCALSLGAKVKLPTLMGDNMILQQQTEVKLWGKATPKAEVRVTPSWSGKTTTCRADKDGNWLLTVSTPKAGYTPYEITFDDGEKTSVKNVLIGEVWLASGQSNMEMPLKGFGGCCIMNGADDIIAAVDNKGVRMFTVPKDQSYEPKTECAGSWNVASLETALDFSATAYHFATSLSRALQIPVGIINSSYGGATVEGWIGRKLLESYPDVSLNPDSVERLHPMHRPLLMYNAMLKPLQNYTIKGFIWYQGESNVGRHDTYAQRLADMVQLWRNDWGLGELPFYFVEIAPYAYGDKWDDTAGAYLREAQFKAQSLIPNSAMVSTNDLVEPFERFNIHPRNKTMVGHRLSYLALNLTYGKKQFVCFGPQYKDLTIEGNKALVSFDHLEMGICRNYDLRGFEVAGEDRVFYPADNVTLRWQTNHIILTSEKVPNPVAVRYCFRNFQSGTMIGGNELPLIPFRTDNW